MHKHKPCGRTWVDNLITPGVRSLECFKDHLKQFYNEWLLEENSALSEIGKIGKPNASLVWDHHLIVARLTKSDSERVKKCYISNVWDEFDDGMLHDGIKDTVNGSSECKEDTRTDCGMAIP